MDHEGTVQLEGRAVAHQLPPSQNYNIVGGDQGGRLLHGRHGSGARLEVEILRVIALDGREDAVEIWP